MSMSFGYHRITQGTEKHKDEILLNPDWMDDDTVEPLNKGHVGDNINSLVLSFVERLSSSRRLQMY